MKKPLKILSKSMSAALRTMGRQSKATESPLNNLHSPTSRQKSHLEELITSRGHICHFYPKYHCELNFIEQYWGAAKFIYRSSPQTSAIDKVEKNVTACLDAVELIKIQR